MGTVKRLILTHCAPTLAGIKAGSMLPIPTTQEDQIQEEMVELSPILKEKNLRIKMFNNRKQQKLLYLYHQKELKKALNVPLAKAFLLKKSILLGKYRFFSRATG